MRWLIVALLSLWTIPVFAQDLTLKRVMLSSGGLGYFEYEAAVEGDATLKLTVSLDQVDDVLKSLVVYDDKGGVGGLSLPGKEPLKQAFKDLPFDESSLQSPAALLATLKGAQVSVGGSRAVTGRIVSVASETVSLNEGRATTTRTRITLLTERGLQQFILEEAENLQFADAALREKVAQALAAIQSNRTKEARTLELAARGQGRRTIRVAYIVEAPVWKASYRMTLPAAPAPAMNDFRNRQQQRGVAEVASAPPPPPVAGSADQFEATEAATQVVFKFPRPVSVENGRTLSIPILDRQVPAQRLALYQADTAGRNPLAAVRPTNDGETGLPPGILTIYERDKAGNVAYVGDARLSGFPVGETRLLAYATDEKITIERDAAQTDRIASGTIAGRGLR